MFRRSFGVLLGLIPAHAGKTTGEGAIRGANGAHPRSRGENVAALLRAAWRVGSSPLTRGKHVELHGFSRLEGGSSPLTRGKPRQDRRAHQRRRLIPAHAGKTSACQHRPAASRAHPRSRGENVTAAKPQQGGAGSSPLTRGKLGAVIGWPRKVGLIPAHAGKTHTICQSPVNSPAHPRSRGENQDEDAHHRFSHGSSPLTRGKLASLRPAPRSPGLIPAHAGKT